MAGIISIVWEKVIILRFSHRFNVEQLKTSSMKTNKKRLHILRRMKGIISIGTTPAVSVPKNLNTRASMH